MSVQRMDNVLIVVEDMEAAIAFFVELGLELEGQTQVEGDWVDRTVGLDGVRADIAMMRVPGGQGRVELTKFHTPAAIAREPRNAPTNTLGIGATRLTARHAKPVSDSISVETSCSTTGEQTMQPNDVTTVLNTPLSQEMLARDITRLAYVATDGTPRNVPMAFVWNGAEIVMCTSKNAPKLASLRANPMAALTIDTEVHPPIILLIRGRAELDVVDGIPDEYLQANSTYQMTPEQRVEWEAEVHSLYDGMVRIVVTPTWAKLIDFETTLPTPVEELIRQREERQRA